MFSELQENTGRQPNKLTKTMHEENKKFSREIEIVKRTKQKSWC